MRGIRPQIPKDNRRKLEPRSRKYVFLGYGPDGAERFQLASCEPIPPLAREPRELVELDDDLSEDPTVASLSGVYSTMLNVDDSSPMNDDSNDMDTLLAI